MVRIIKEFYSIMDTFIGSLIHQTNLKVDIFLSMLSLLCLSASFEFQHNVCGRSIYAEGTIDAAIFLHRKVV